MKINNNDGSVWISMTRYNNGSWSDVPLQGLLLFIAFDYYSVIFIIKMINIGNFIESGSLSTTTSTTTTSQNSSHAWIGVSIPYLLVIVFLLSSLL